MEVKKRELCFCCLSKDHWSNRCFVKKHCQVDACKGYHHKLLHRVENKEANHGPPKEENVGATSESRQPSQVKRSISVLLQVIPVTIHGANGSLNIHAMLDNGSTCSLVVSDVADKLSFKAPQKQIILNGIQGTSQTGADLGQVQSVA